MYQRFHQSLRKIFAPLVASSMGKQEGFINCMCFDITYRCEMLIFMLIVEGVTLIPEWYVIREHKLTTNQTKTMLL